jgi:acetylornithine deacetylase/succinyl-diaminopimelate desuccinylase-like protein
MKILGAILLISAAASAQPRYAVDWQALQPEILDRFAELLRIDSSNPPGNETKVVRQVQADLGQEGISSQIFSADPNRANLVARIKGSGRKKPILLMGHTDVVGVQRDKWTVDPFAAIRKNGYIYGRGATDDKEHVIAGIVILSLLQRLHVRLDRDVIFLAEAGEEGTSSVGIDYMVQQHWPEIECEYALAEGGSIVEENGKVHHIQVNTTEKLPRGVKLVAHGRAGHGSRPIPDNAIVRLATAVARVGSWQTPVRLNETTRVYFEKLAAIAPPAEAQRFREALDPARLGDADRYFREHDPTHYSIIRTSVVPTMLNGGFRANVIPSEAEAYLDVRALPDEDINRFLGEMRRVIGDSTVDVSLASRAGRPAGAPSRLDTEMYRALEKAGDRLFSAPTLPGMLTGATDMAQLRARGVQAYGVGPAATAEQGPLGGAHSDDERISIAGLMKMIEYMWNAVLEVAAAP